MASQGSPLLRCFGLSRHFGGVRAVRDVDLEVRTGEFLAIIGPNGAGKTTLFNLLTRQVDPSSGRIVLGDRDITAIAAHELPRLGVARTFQRTNLFWDLTVRENIRLAVHAQMVGGYALWARRDAYPAVKARVDQVLDEVGLAGHAELPARKLSHGDMRLTEVAIALGSSPRLLLLDEPLAGMAPTETRQTVELLNRIRRNVSIVLIEHDMDVVLSIADRIVVLDFGQVIASGAPAEIRANARVQEAYFGTPE